MAALFAGIVSALALIVLVIVSAVNEGETSEATGIIGIVFMLVGLLGFVGSAVSSRERDIYYAVPVAGMITGGVTFVLYTIIFVIGL